MSAKVTRLSLAVALSMAMLFILLAMGEAVPAQAQTDNCIVALDGDGTTRGSWSRDCLSVGSEAAYARYYSFTLSETTNVTITLESSVDTYLFIRHGAGRGGPEACSNDDYEDDVVGEGCAFISTSLPSEFDSGLVASLDAGYYVIEATTFSAARTGTFTLTVSGLSGGSGTPTTPTATATASPEPADDCVGSIDQDGSVSGEWTSDCGVSQSRSGSYARYYTLTVSQTTELTITLVSDEDPYLNLLEGAGRGGRVLHLNDDHDEDVFTLPSGTDSGLSATLAAGEYTIEATTYSPGITGQFVLTVSGLPSGTAPTPTPEPPPTPGPSPTPTPEPSPTPSPGPADECVSEISEDGVTSGRWTTDCTSESRFDSYARYYAFALSADAEITITLESAEDTVLYLLEGAGKEGDEVCRNDDYALGVTGRVCEAIEGPLAGQYDSGLVASLTAGDYTIEATTFEEEVTGEFKLTVTGLESGGDVTSRAEIAELAAMYAPVLRLDPSEEFYPQGVEAFVENANLVYEYAGGAASFTIISVTPDMLAPENLERYSSQLPQGAGEYDPGNWYLDVPDSIKTQPQASHPPRVYATVRYQSGDVLGVLGEHVYLQYHLFYFYDHLNPGFLQANCVRLSRGAELAIVAAIVASPIPLPVSLVAPLGLEKNCYPHESDWELVQLEFRANSVEEILDHNIKPFRVAYSQHGWSEDSDYEDVPTVDGYPIAYVAIGKHANYFGPDPDPSLLGSSPTAHDPWSLSLVQDIISDRGREILPEALSHYAEQCPDSDLDSNLCATTYELEVIDDDTPWVAYEGGWGGDLRVHGPDQPLRWHAPRHWMSGLGVDLHDYSGEARDLAVLNAAFHHWGWDDDDWRDDFVTTTGRGDRVTRLEFRDQRRELDFSSSRTIPPSLGDLSHLQVLDIHGNDLEGAIPRQLGYLNRLEELYLHSNELGGEIPPSLGSLPVLESVYLASNELMGCIPAGLEDVQDNDFDDVGLTFCGDIVPDPPTEICVDSLDSDGIVSRNWDGECASQNRSGSFARYYTFTLEEESDVTIILRSMDVDTYLFLLEGSGRDGRVLHENDDIEPGSITDSRIVRTLSPGTYTIEATTYGAGTTGPFTLAINGMEPAESCEETIDSDGIFNGNWTNACPSEGRSGSYAAYYTFTLTQSADVTITAESGVNTWLFLREGAGRNGTVVDENDDHDSSEFSLGSTTDSGIAESLEAGSYTIEVTTYTAGEAGEFTLTISGLSAAVTPAPPPDSSMTDRAGLVALYNATDGPNWPLNDNWLSEAPLGAWSGVTTDADGRVIELRLQFYRLRGEIPAELGNLSKLAVLFLLGNQLSGEIPPELGDLSNLKWLYLNNNQLSGEIPAELGNLSNLKWLYLYSNQLRGEIPAELGNLSNLERLRLHDNQLSGEIPPELGDLSNLKWLYLYSNQLRGEIPPELGNLSNLERLRLHDNQLSGEIPAELGNLSNLGGLFLERNQLSGEIPPELGNLANLGDLFLRNNQLSGEIPAELSNLSNLRRLYLSNNQLSGCVPGGLRDVRINDFAELGLPFCSN